MSRFARLAAPLCLFAIGCSGTPRDSGAQQQIEYLLREQVQRLPKLEGVAFGVVGEAEVGARRAIVFWPALRNNELIDDDIVGAVFEKSGDQWQLISEHELSHGDSGRTALYATLGSPTPAIARNCGVSRSELPRHLPQWIKRFRQARREGDATAAMEAYEQAARSFAWPHVAFDDMLPEILEGAPDDLVLRCDENQCAPASQTKGGRKVTFAIEACGGGFVLGAMTP